MKTLNNLILTGLSVLSLNNLYSQDKSSLKDSLDPWEKTSLKQLIFESRFDLKHSEAIKKYIPITKQEIQSDTSRFNILNAGLKEYINKIYIIGEEDFFDSDAGAICGHAHPYGGIICLAENFVNRSLFHETGHIRYSFLEEINSDFLKEWEQIANFEYGKHNFYNSKDKLKIIAKSQGALVWKDETIGPKNGCLEPSAGASQSEDVAVFIGSLGYEETPKSLKNFYDSFKVEKDKILKGEDDTLKLGLNLEVYLAYFPLYFADTTDHRYKQKLDLLKEYNFFTKEEHEKLINNLGSLNYLLKEKK